MKSYDDTGIIFDIQSYSVHDGPGCRTSIFFAGCPLHCQWCANPEGMKQRKQLLFSEHSCKWEQHCTACKDSCPHGAISFDGNGKIHLNRQLCDKCESIECAGHCAANALKQCGRSLTVDDLMAIIKRDMQSWGPRGGVTFTGGEPLLQHIFLSKVLERCHKEAVSTAIESSGYAPLEVFLKIYTKMDFAFVDVKNFDDERHRQGTSVSNAPILRNIAALAASGWKGRLVLRTPVIAGYNDSRENAAACIEFMQTNNLFEINLLPFHRLGSSKWQQLGQEYKYNTGGDITKELLSDLQDQYLKNDIACYIGDDTPF